jgi:hypothetical protein
VRTERAQGDEYEAALKLVRNLTACYSTSSRRHIPAQGSRSVENASHRISLRRKDWAELVYIGFFHSWIQSIDYVQCLSSPWHYPLITMRRTSIQTLELELSHDETTIPPCLILSHT